MFIRFTTGTTKETTRVSVGNEKFAVKDACAGFVTPVPGV